MMRFTARNAQLRSKIDARVKGSTIILRWRDWPEGRPDADPTSGNVVPTVEQPVLERTLNFKAHVHFVTPVQGMIRPSRLQTWLA